MTLCRQLEVEGPESTAPTLTLGMGAEGGRRGGSQTPGGGAGWWSRTEHCWAGHRQGRSRGDLPKDRHPYS